MSDQEKTPLRNVGKWANLSIIGIQFPIAILIGMYFGRWLDGIFDTKPWLMMIFLIFGVAAGFLNMYRITKDAGLLDDDIDGPSGDDESLDGDG